MQRRVRLNLGLVALALAAALVAGYLLRPGPQDRPEVRPTDVRPTDPPVPAPLPRAEATAPAPAVARPGNETPPGGPGPARRQPEAVPVEALLMASARELVVSDPARAIEVAREGNRHFPDSADAAERAWIVVKALANLRRFHEARDEAKAMVQKYPGNSWTMDAQRHLLVNPLDLPSREEQQKSDQR